jgi:hypothetical protein
MHVIGHDYGRVQTKLVVIEPMAAFENNVPGRGRKFPSAVGGECDEEGMIVFLIVR